MIMLGLGNWQFKVDTMFYRGNAILKVGEKNGEYDIGLEIPGMDNIPPIIVVTINAEGNTISGTAKNDLLGNKEIPFSITIDGDRASGFLKVPFMGKLTLKDGVRID